MTAVEMGQRNHEIVPVSLIDSIAGLKHGGTYRCLKLLLRHKLVHHDNCKYDGFRLTYLGYDFLAIRALSAKGLITAVGQQIGVGKESDIFEVINEEGEVLVLKLHRLGRTSFRAVKAKRDYLRHRSSFSWLYLSRLAALKEFAFMRALGERGFAVPQAVEQNRHAVLMSLVDGGPMVQVRTLQNPGSVYRTCMSMAAQLASWGLVHCDFNEFNLLINDEETVTCIDFPQMVSTSHANAEELYERDVQCIVRFFKKKIGYMPEQDPDNAGVLYTRFQEAVASGARDGSGSGLDVELSASGFNANDHKALEEAFAQQRQQEEDAGTSQGEASSGSEADEVDQGTSGQAEEVEGVCTSTGPSLDAEAELGLAACVLAPGSSGKDGSDGESEEHFAAEHANGDGAGTLGTQPTPAATRAAGVAGATTAGQQQEQQPGGTHVDQYVAEKMARERRKTVKREGMVRASRNAAKDKTRNNRRSVAASMF